MARRPQHILLCAVTLLVLITTVGCGSVKDKWNDLFNKPAACDSGQQASEEFAGKQRILDALKVSETWTPGAVVVVGTGSTVQMIGSTGHTDWQDTVPINGATTQYQLDSVTKTAATAVVAMKLYEQGKLDLEAPLSTYWPELPPDKATITAKELLTHSSGMPRGQIEAPNPEAAMQQLLATPLGPRGEVLYSNTGTMLLWEAMDQIVDGPLEEFATEHIWRPLGMCKTQFNPPTPCADCAPSIDSSTPGISSDPGSVSFGGVTGSAGLFSTGTDLGRLAAVMTEGGTLDGVKVFERKTVELFTTHTIGPWALGWGIAGSGAEPIPPEAFGRTGWNGTSMLGVYDAGNPSRRSWAVVLTNFRMTGGPEPLNDSQLMDRLNTLRREAFLAVLENPPPAD